MRFLLGLILLCVLLPVFVDAQVQFGLGANTSLFGYNRDELDGGRIFWGGHARVRVIKYFAGEFSVQYREDTFGFRNGDIKLETFPVQLSGIVYPLAMIPITPYFVGGIGWYRLKATINGDLDLPFVFGQGSVVITETAPHIGVGLEAFIGDHFSIGGDVRYVFLDFETDLINYKYDAVLTNIAGTFYF
jgi:Outer membrane protein beta-barrel domain